MTQKNELDILLDWLRKNAYTIGLIVLIIGVLAFLRDVNIIPRGVGTFTIILIIVGLFLILYTGQKRR